MRHTGLLPLLLVAGVTGVVFANEEVAPIFKSIPTTVKTTEHDTVLLPCYVQNQGTNKVKWWRGEHLIAVSYPRTVLTDNVILHGNNTLQVSDLRHEDSGPYTCQVIREPPWGPINQTHVITVLLPPTVRMHPDIESLDVDQHKEVTLNCSASGVPKPLITWTFNGDEIQLLSHRSALRILASGSRMSGEYACIASNGVGDLATASLQLRVTYPPVVTTPKIWIQTAPGMRTEIFCDIDASPKAKVEWLQDKLPVDTGTRIVTTRKGTTHGLIILKTKKSDFGYYACTASNSKGRGQQVIHISGVPDIPKFKESYFQRDEKNVSLAWQVDSYSSIIQYNLLFRQYKTGEKLDNWTRLIIPADVFSNGPLHDQTFALTGLTAATIYESSVLARNVFGWSKPSNIYRFATVGADADSIIKMEEGTESNVIGDYMSAEYVTMDTWNSWKNSSNNLYFSNVFFLFLISFLHWWHEFRNYFI